MSEREPGQLALDAFYQREGDKSIWEFTPAEQRLPWARVEVAIRADERAAQAARIAELERERDDVTNRLEEMLVGDRTGDMTIIDNYFALGEEFGWKPHTPGGFMSPFDHIVHWKRNAEAAEARIAELESERDAATEACAVEYRNYEAAEARNAVLVEALTPLATMDRLISEQGEPAVYAFDNWPAERVVFNIGKECLLSVANLRNARAAIAANGDK